MKALFENGSCFLCPRQCGARRSEGEKGYCGTDDRLIVARAALHMWEEPCISGDRGSGTVFFSGCSLGCVFCQNNDIAGCVTGREITVQRLSEIFLELRAKGALNINLVTPGHYIPQIREAILLAKENGLTLPILYNGGGYDRAEAIKLLDGLVDIWLPDFKYYGQDMAQKYSAAPDYFKYASESLAEMVRQTKETVFEDDGSEDGVMKSGVIVRHLLLPGGLEDSKKVVRYLHETYGDRIYISLMSQYTPMKNIGKRYPELDRKVSEEEYEELIDYAIDLGVENGFIQEGDVADESFIPSFDGTGVDRIKGEN